MKHPLRRSLVAGLAFGAMPFAVAESPMKIIKATGPFDVKLAPASAADAAVGRFTLDKKYHGDLEGAGIGEMLTALTAVKGSAGYVAIEQVTGTLAGRTGTFQLQHHGTMNRSAPTLLITVVPDSGTGELAGLAGRMSISIAADGAHYYTFEYSLPKKD